VAYSPNPAAYTTAAIAICRDYQLLAETARVEAWTDETPVPPDFFGPMWPDGVPGYWYEIPDDATDEIRADPYRRSF